MDKHQQRSLIGNRLKDLANKEEKSSIITKELSKHLNSSKTIAGFMPMANEPDITSLFNDSFCFPKCLNDCEMEFFRANEFTISKYGIKEPKNGTLIKPEDIDTIIVPLVAFDGKLQRLGHGAGYYDRYLTKCPNALKIGVAFECQKLDEIACDVFDIRLDMIISESKTYRKQ